jgi:GNAT superfamily N-acetyltransferase
MNKNTSIIRATEAELPAIADLLNRSYRGESSRKGWTTEADLISGNVRTDLEDVTRTLQKPGSIFLICRSNTGDLIGCVNLQQHGARLYLGMFAVSPEEQGKGTGGLLMDAAEDWGRDTGCGSVYMWVISLRKELIGWYQRKGYTDTGERIPFREDGLSGKHLLPLTFLVLEKNI